jgi:xanthine dehydrogenase molybdenum-binding subunit
MAEHYQPWTWEIPESDESIKRNMIPRQDGYERVSGKAVFTRDVCLPGMLHAKILASPYAHAKIVSMDTSQAEALVGVRDILKYDDPDVRDENITSMWHYNILTLPGIADFYNHPMGVVVVADSEEICDRALRLIKIEWEERPFILDMEQALKPDAPKIWPEVVPIQPTAEEPNKYFTREEEKGDIEKGFAEADKVFEYTIKRGVPTTAGVEAIGCVAQWRGEFLDVWVHHQISPQSVLSSGGSGRGGAIRGKENPPLAHWSKITLTFPYQGAWFGGLSNLAYSMSFVRLAAIVSKRVDGKPVKLLFDESQFYLCGEETGTYTCKVGAKKDGTITAYHWHMVGLANPGADKTPKCTRIPHYLATSESAYTNRGHITAYRHGSSASIGHQVMFDRVSAEFGLDPTEVALKNDGCEGHGWDWVTRYQKDNGFPQRWSLKEVIDKGKAAIDWNRKWHAPGAQKLANGRMHGMGFMSINQWLWDAGGRLACLNLRDGKVAMVGLRSNPGMDSESGFRQCVAAVVGLKYEDTVIHQHRSDNSMFEFCLPGGSLGTIHTTPQLVVAARELKQRILHAAVTPRRGAFGTQGAVFEDKKPEDLDIKDSMVFEKANPNNNKPIAEVFNPAPRNDDSGIVHPVGGTVSGLTSDGKPDSYNYCMSRQAHFIEVEVDTETGQVEITNVVCANDLGHVFNPEGVMGQQYGGAVMGLGRSATEEKVYCPRTGVGLNFDIINYYMGTMNDYAPVQCILNESHLGYSAYGACGMGENVGAALAGITSSAIYNAIGEWVLDFPTTPDKVLKALGKI